MLRFELQVEAAEQATEVGTGPPKSDEQQVADGASTADVKVPSGEPAEPPVEVTAAGQDGDQEEAKAESGNDDKSDDDGDGKPLNSRRARAAEAREKAKAKGTEFSLCLCGPHSSQPLSTRVPRNRSRG